MVEEWQSRTALLLGEGGVSRLSSAHVLVVGLGGVGGYAAELLVRAGVGELTLADADHVELSNVNRQIVALHSTIGRSKVEVACERMLDINPGVRLHGYEGFIGPDSLDGLLGVEYDVVVDAIDTLSPKLFLLMGSLDRGYRLVSSMGSGRRMDGRLVRVDDIWESRVCPLAAVVRKRLRRHGKVDCHFPVVYSEEAPVADSLELTDGSGYHRSRVGVISYVPAIFGSLLAGEACRILLGEG